MMLREFIDNDPSSMKNKGSKFIPNEGDKDVRSEVQANRTGGLIGGGAGGDAGAAGGDTAEPADS